MNHHFNICPIGQIQVKEQGFFLAIHPEYLSGLKELQEFSHICVLWWSHLIDNPENRNIIELDRPYQNAPSKIGVFATRSPLRPNPISLSTAAIIQIDPVKGLIQVAWLDAEDGTPIIDIKPYHPSNDRVREVTLPKWCAHWPKWYEDSARFDWEKEFITAQ